MDVKENDGHRGRSQAPHPSAMALMVDKEAASQAGGVEESKSAKEMSPTPASPPEGRTTLPTSWL